MARGKHGEVVAEEVPLSCRPHIIGRAELMGYLGVDCYSTLIKNYISRGLHCDMLIGSKEYFLKTSVDKWLVTHSKPIELSFHDELEKRLGPCPHYSKREREKPMLRVLYRE